ncbi:hypothetical protein CRENBAI_023580 [Crenichthys baileyi]|uniref:Retinoblastoma-associated protein-like n=1 Tax=Crenichthys baileyi TaxID=28760 RepID=A0AAV9QSE6_9TELE
MATTPQRDVNNPRPGTKDHLITLFRGPMQGIEIRLEGMLREFFQHHRMDKENETTKEQEERCCLEATDCYYSILEHLTTRKRASPGVSRVSDVLENDLIQRCLVACCLQIALKSHCLVSDITLLLKVFKLDAYLFLKVTDFLLLNLGKFMGVVKSIVQIHTRILESLVWVRCSCLWKEISANGGYLPSYEQLISPTTFEEERTDLQPESDPQQVDVMMEAAPSASADHQHSSSALNRPKKKPFLHRFASMVYSVLKERLMELCSKLDISDGSRKMMWTCLVHSLVQHNSLMEDRHLDQLLISAVSIIAKVTKNKLNFEEIVKHYRPHVSESVCKDMLISEATLENLSSEMMDLENLRAALPTPEATPEEDKRGSLINFYRAYSKKMQGFADKFAPTYGGETPPMSPFPQQKKRSYRPFKGHNITISQLNKQEVSPLTPRMTYDFSKSPSERLRKINIMVTKGPRALSFETEEGEEGPSSKQRCLDEGPVLQNRLRALVNDRAEVQNQGWVSQKDLNQPDNTWEH